MRQFTCIAAAVAALSLPHPTAAQESTAAPRVGGAVFLGAAAVPAYEGATSQRIFPFLGGRVQSGQRYLALEGLSARANFLSAPGVEIGPILSFAFGRTAPLDSRAVTRLGEIDNTLEVGAFVAISTRGPANRGDDIRLSLQASRGVTGGHHGWQGALGLSYAAPIGNSFRLGLDLGLSLVDDEYATTWFSVTTAGAAKSGLPVFRARGGIKDVGATLTGTSGLGSHWLALGFAGYRRLIGDAAGSPIVKIEGRSNQISGGLGLGYAF